MKLLSRNDFFELSEIDFESMPFFFQPGYLKANDDILILQKGTFCAPINIKKNKILKTVQFQFPPISLKGDALNTEEEKEFCESAIQFIIENKIADRIQQPKNYSLFKATPAKSISCKFGTYKIDLHSKTNDQLLEGMQARYRSAIRQIEKFNVEIRFGIAELKVFQKLHNETMERTGAYSENYDSLKKELEALPDNTLLATIYIDGKVQGGLFVVYSKFSAYYFHGASANTTEASGALKYLHYKVMCLLKEKNVKTYDFVGARFTDVSGTKLEGIQNFKKRFGSELIKGYLWKLDINKTKCIAYDNLLRMKCKLKGTKFPIDIIDQERKNISKNKL